MATRRLPFDAERSARVSRFATTREDEDSRAERLRSAIIAEVPQSLCTFKYSTHLQVVVGRLLEKDPRQRPEIDELLSLIPAPYHSLRRPIAIPKPCSVEQSPLRDSKPFTYPQKLYLKSPNLRYSDQQPNQALLFKRATLKKKAEIMPPFLP